MISIVIATRDPGEELLHTLSALVAAAADGTVREVVIADAGTGPAAEAIADEAGCTLLSLPGRSHGALVAAALAEAHRGAWFLVLAPGTVLGSGWQREAAGFIERMERSAEGPRRAATFRYTLDDLGAAARLGEGWQHLTGRLTGVPTASTGLLVARRQVERIGGFADLPAPFDHADFLARLGRGRLHGLATPAVVMPAARAENRTGALAQGLLALRVPPRSVARLASTR